MTPRHSIAGPVPAFALRPEHVWLVAVPSNLAGATAVYLYFAYLDPLGGPVVDPGIDLALFVVVTSALVAANWAANRSWLRPVVDWLRSLEAGASPDDATLLVRRRTLNAALVQAAVSLATWGLAGLLYAGLEGVVQAGTWIDCARIAFGIVIAGGIPTSAITFLLAEFHWRRRIPQFFPDGRLELRGVLRIPVRYRLVLTFLLTSIVPLGVLVVLAIGMTLEFADAVPTGVRTLWTRYVWAQVYIVTATGFASVVMGLLVARFINRPVQALRRAMTAVERGDFRARVPVRSTDELGELNARFNAMVGELRRAAETRELFGRYVSPEVARRALERGVELGGEVVEATAMFADLRGFTARSERLRPDQLVTLLASYYETIESICQDEQGIVTQFLGDGVVAVFGGPLLPVADHARRAVRAARRLQAVLAGRSGPDGDSLQAGIGICTGSMVAGNVGAGRRLIYTIVGDAVNQAARLQVQTRTLPASILVTESTRRALPPADRERLRFCGRVALKGIASEVPVWAVDA